MHAPILAALAAALAMFRLTGATCLLRNQMEPDPEPVPEAMCVRQAEGNYHLSFRASSMCVPTLDVGGTSGCAGGTGWKLFD